MPLPFDTLAQALPLPTYELRANSTNGATPRTASFDLTAAGVPQGVYLYFLAGYRNSTDDTALSTGLLTWYWPSATGTAVNVGLTQTHASTAGQLSTSCTLAAPNSAGVCVATHVFTGGANWTIPFLLRLVQLATAGDFARLASAI